MICKHCGKEIEDSLSECPYCHASTVEVEEFTFKEGEDDGFARDDNEGQASSNQSEAPAYCPLCGTKVGADMLYCPVCGKNLRGSGFAGGAFYNRSESEADDRKKNSDSQTLGVLSLVLWIFSRVIGIILGALAIHYGKKENNPTAVKLGVGGVVLSSVILVTEIIIVAVNFAFIMSWFFPNGAQLAGIF